jgi:ZIP family zinc transporter
MADDRPGYRASVLTTVLYASGASLPLVAGAVLGVRWSPPQRLVAAALAFAAGALVVSASFELFEPAYESGGAWRSGLAFLAGAAVFVAADGYLEHRTAGSAAGLALLAGVTLDGIPENTALGVSLNESASVALLVAIFASNFPEALAGARRMLEKDRSPAFVIGVWSAAAVLLAAAVFGGRYLFAGVGSESLAFPLAFAGGAVLASVVDTLAPEAFGDGGPAVALASAAGFVTGFLLSL